jgi:hypothetical protein
MNRNTIALLALFAVLGGCATTDADETDTPARGTNTPTADPTPMETVPDEPEPEPTTEGPSVLALGDTASWDDGLEVTVGKPQELTPSETALEFMTAQHPHYLKFPIRVVNGTSAPYDASAFLISVQSSNQEGEVVFDTESGLEGGPMTAVLPGRETEFFYGFGVGDPTDLVVEVAPGFEWDVVFFEGAAQ